MTRTVQGPAPGRKAKGIHAPSEADGQQVALFPSSVAAEAGESLARALRVYKAEAIGAEIGLSRSSIYELAAHPERIPVGALPKLEGLDPDPAALSRIAHALLVEQAGLAAKRKAAGEVSFRFRPSRSEQGDLFQ